MAPNSKSNLSRRLNPPNHRTADEIQGHPQILTARGVDHRDPEGTYNRSLILSGNGVPLFKPGYVGGEKREVNPVAQRGLRIGDVGVVDAKNGGFRYFFNIFLPKDHPEQYKIFYDSNFTPFETPLDELPVRTVPEYHKPGTVITSPGVEIKLVEENVHHFTFSSDENEGGLLVLPLGASREDLVDPSVLNEYLSQHAAEFYKIANPVGLTKNTNGTLIVITGCDKARDWATAVFPASFRDDTATGEYVYAPGEITSGTLWLNMANSAGRSHEWPLEAREESRVDEYGASIPANQCVFLRGTTIALNNEVWSRLNLSPILPTWKFHAIIRLEKTPMRKTLDSVRDRLGMKTDIGVAEEAKARDLARLHKEKALFQPVYVISEALLKIFTEVNVVIVNDDCWCPFAEGGTCTVDEVNNLVSRVFESHEPTTIEISGGLALVLVKKPESELEKIRKKKRKEYGHWADYVRLKYAGFEKPTGHRAWETS